MATSIQLLRKYVWIIETIRRARKITLEELNSKWADNTSLRLPDDERIAPRSFFRHRNAIADIFGIDISCEKSTNTYYIENEEVLDSPMFSSWVFNWLSLDNQISGNPEVAKRIIHEEIPGGSEYLAPIIDALAKNRKIKIEYNRYYTLSNKTHIVEPYGLKQSNRRWYLIGKPDGKESLTVFALDRIGVLSETDEGFVPDDNLNVKTYFNEVIGINVDEEYEVEEVQIRVFGQQRYFIESLPLHKSLRIVDRTPEYSELRLKVRPEPQFQMELFKFGSAIEVISPRWLREEMIWRAEEMLKRYSL